MKAYIEQAKQIIATNQYMTIATSSLDGKPWISPVFFAYDQRYNLFWLSNKDSLHSQLIKSNRKVAIVIFDSTAPEGEGDAVYFEAEAFELEDPRDIEHAIDTYDKRATKDEFKAKSIAAITGKAFWRMYKAVPMVVSKLDEGEFREGQYRDKRVNIDLLDRQ